MAQENLQIIRRLFEDLGSRRSVGGALAALTDEALAEFYDPEIEWRTVSQSPLALEVYRGYDGVRQFWSDFLSPWEEFSIEAKELIEAGDQVAVVSRLSGRLQGIEVDETYSSLFTLRDGRVLAYQGFRSREEALRAAGPAR